MTLVEYVDSAIDDPGLGDHRWYPTGFLLKKGGVVHVQSGDSDKSICGIPLEDGKHTGPARGMLRRSKGCSECEALI